jgi:signal peptidase
MSRLAWYGAGFLMVGILALGVYGIYALPGLGGYTILSSSMEPAIPRGSLVLVHTKLPTSYHANDIITFTVPGKPREYVTHRITRVVPASMAEPAQILTKGDANTNGDPWILSPGNIRGSVVVRVPYLGYLLYGLHTVLGFILAAGAILLWWVVPFVIAQFRS